jgi:protein TonB
MPAKKHKTHEANAMFDSTTQTPIRKSSTLLSLTIHGTAAALLFTIASNHEVQRVIGKTSSELTTLIAPYMPQLKPKPTGGGGGGGDRSLLRASQGRLPKIALKQFTPPMAVVHNAAPKLIMEPTIIAPPDAVVPIAKFAMLGDPNGIPGPPSGGRGSRGGIGDGDGTGVGPGRGPGYGPGEDGGIGGGPGGGAGSRGAITAPQVLSMVEPEYSEEARRARVQGAVVLYIEVGPQGKAQNVRVVQQLGLGLDERAIEAVMKWKFRPGSQNGKPVTTSARVDVFFHLL